jgi:DNA polymerase-3 subunit epsilon
MRQIVLDTETTGLEPSEGHRIIEVGCVEVVDRRLTRNNLHLYINPDREVDEGALEVHGIGNEFLADKPRFAEIVDDLLAYLDGAELLIHNAPFDVGFLNHELSLLGERYGTLEDRCTITDTLELARARHQGQRNSLDALCKRYEVDNSGRDLHGALLDAELLADVYLRMTGGQVNLFLSGWDADGASGSAIRRLPADRPPLPVIRASDEELAAHQAALERIDKASAGQCLWKQLLEGEG